MNVEQIGCEIRGQSPSAKLFESFDHHDIGAQHARRGGDLESDPAAADDDESRAFAEIGADRGAVVDAAEIMDALKLLPLDRELADPAPGGDQQLVVCNRAAARERDGLPRALDRGRFDAGPELDPELVERAFRPQDSWIPPAPLPSRTSFDKGGRS